MKELSCFYHLVESGGRVSISDIFSMLGWLVLCKQKQLSMLSLKEGFLSNYACKKTYKNFVMWLIELTILRHRRGEPKGNTILPYMRRRECKQKPKYKRESSYASKSLKVESANSGRYKKLRVVKKPSQINQYHSMRK